MFKNTLITALVMSLSSITAANETESQWYINPTLGYQYLDGDRNLDNDGVYGIGGEYRFNESWGSELKYLQGSTDSDGSGSNDADMKHLFLEGMYYLNSAKQKFSPYIAAGLGHQEFDYDTSGEDDGTTALFGPGFRYKFDDRWSSKVDLRWVHGLDDSENDGLLSVALSYALGKAKSKPVQKAIVGDADNDGVNDDMDLCPNTPIGTSIDSKGCDLDSDNDGVLADKDQCPNTVAGVEVDSAGCAEKLTHTETIVLNVSFVSGSAQLTDGFMAGIEKAALFMRKYPSVMGVIEGHADSSGSATFNEKLSQRRAENVRSVFVDQLGIDAERLKAIGYGDSRPVASNDNTEGRGKNRRVAAVFETQVTE